MQVWRLVIDVLIPHELGVLACAESICDLASVDGLTIRVGEVDDRTKTLEITIEGKAIDFESIRESIEKAGGSIHSVDEVSAGTRVVSSPRKDRGMA